MRTVWQQDGREQSVTAPLSLVISAFAGCVDVRNTLTPELRRTEEKSVLLLVDLGRGRNRLGGSALAQVYGQVGDVPPDLDDPEDMRVFYALVNALRKRKLLWAYHDRSDGGLVVAVAEMLFASRLGATLHLPEGLAEGERLAWLFNEELGGVFQVPFDELEGVLQICRSGGLGDCVHVVGSVTTRPHLSLVQSGLTLYDQPVADLQEIWSSTTLAMQSLRDDPECAREEHARISDANDPGLTSVLTFVPEEKREAPWVARNLRPPVAILREQGVNGHVEMAMAFHRAGFSAVDVHMSDLLSGRRSLADFSGFVACGGFSYGDVLGAGEGWAKSILFNAKTRDDFSAFFERKDVFALGVCNGCQMMSALSELIPGTGHWPRFMRNRSEQFEARLVLVQVEKTPSLFFAGMEGSRIPVPVAHGEGRVVFSENREEVRGLVPLRYVDGHGRMAHTYPLNPNGSPEGIAGVTSTDGRFTICMPHPERAVRTVQLSWHPDGWGEEGPWLKMFQNARKFIG